MSREPPADEPAVAEGSFASSRRIAFNTVVRTVGEILAKAASVALFIAIARMLGEGKFGDFTFGLSLSVILLAFAGLGTDELIAREVARDRTRVHDLLANVIALRAGLLLVLVGVMGAIVTIAGYPFETRVAVVLIGFGAGFEMLNNTVYAVFQGYERMQYTSVSLVVQRTSGAALGITVLVLGGGLIAVCVAFLAGTIIGFVTAMGLLRSRVASPQATIERGRWPEIVRAGLPLGLVVLLFMMLLKLDTAMLSFLTGEDNVDVGIYGAAYRLVEATMFLSWAFSGAILPWLSRHRGRGEGVSLARGYELGLKGTLTMLLPIAVLYALYADQLIDLIYGASYAESADSLRLLAAMTVLFGLNTYASMVLISRNQPGSFARAAAVIVVQNVIFNFILIPEYGPEGAAFNAVLSGALLAIVSLRAAARVTGSRARLAPLASPVLAAAAMAAVIWLAGTTAPAAIAAVAAYAFAFAAVEWLGYRSDFELYSGVLDMLRARRRTGASTVPPEIRETG